MQKKKFYIKTYGCQMNVYDSKRMMGVLANMNFTQTDDMANSDLVILNTCHIREKASEKVYSELGRIALHKKNREKSGDKMLIAVAGCVAQAEGEEIISRAPFVDIVMGPQTYHRLSEFIKNADDDNEKMVDLDFSVDEKFSLLPNEQKSLDSSAFLTIQEGCDKFCTYCVVPYTRGAEFSRSVEEILLEAVRLTENGVKEITLLGQNVNGYRTENDNGEKNNLGKLIRTLAEIDNLERIRYTTSHPLDMNDNLIKTHMDIEKLMPYLHLPVQSGSDTILKAMNRGHTADDYRKIIEKIRVAKPDIAISSDFIVGFPGESDKDFRKTIKLIEDVEFSQSYSFKYSKRLGTPAATMEDSIPEHVKKERLLELQTIITKHQNKFNSNTIGKTLQVLFTSKGKYENQIQGLSPYMQPVCVSVANDEIAKNLLNKVADVKIVKLFSNSLEGVLDSS